MNFPEIGAGKLISVTNIHRLSDDGGRITSRRYEADYHTHRLLNSGVFCAISSSRQQAPDNNVIRFDTKPSLNLVCANFDDYGPVSIVSLDGAFHQGLNIPHMIRCQNCETNYPTKYQYQRHQCEFNAERVVLKPNADLMNLDKNQQRVKYDCPTCGKQFVSKNNLDRHQASHKSSKENTCEHCNKQFVSENRLRIHKENHCKKAGDISKFYRSDVTVWKCRKCQEVFSSSTTAGFHIEICDEFMDLSSTALADDRTTADENGVVDLTTVKKEPFSQQQPQDGANNAPQQLTSTTTSSPISTNHEQQRLCSGVATATTTTTPTAVLPTTDCKIIEKISTELLLQCEFCNRTYADKSVLLRHQKTHKTDRNYECAICKDSFTSYVSATQHWLRKCSEKANLFYLPKLTYCEFCDRTFKSHEILYTHKIKKKHYTPKTHAGIREMTNEAAEGLDRLDNNDNNNDDTTGNNGDRHNNPTSDECPMMMTTNGSNGNGRFIKNEGVIDKLIEDVLIALEIPINSKHSLSGSDSKCSMNRNHNNNNDNDKENVEDFIREIKREPQNPTEDEKSNENDNDYSATEETNDIDNNNNNNNNNNNTKNNNDNNNNNNNNDDDNNNNNNNNNDNNNNKNNNNNNDNDNDDNNNNNMTSKDQHQLEKKKRGRKRKMNNNKHQNSSGKSKRMFADYPDEGFKFQCERCDKVWDTVIDLEDHREREHAANYSCDECGQVLHSARALLIHSRAHKSLKPYVCETCGRSYSQTSHLWQHMRFHQGIKPFACPHEGCEARYTIRPDLKDHIRKVHTRERPFKCNVCGKCFLTGSVYYQHRLIHTEDRRYGCDMCEKRFFRADALNNHKRIHTNERPYPCFVCGRMFRQKGDRNKHFRTQHPDAIMN